MDRVRLLDDRPLDPSALKPNGELIRLARLFAQSIRDARGPMIIHVDGAWGRGKTSFCKYLDAELGRSDPDRPRRRTTTSWYIASDESANPWDAVLAAVARAVNDGDKEATRAVVDRWGSTADQFGDTLEEFRHFVARELGHEASVEGALELPRLVDERPRPRLEPPLDPPDPDPATVADPPAPDGSNTLVQTYEQYTRPHCQAIVFVDDLDRCRPDHVLAVFDAVRAFATCPGLAFVLAADRNVLEGASKKLVARLETDAGALASDALEKYIRHRVVLPRFRDLDADNRTEVMAPMEHALLRGDGEPGGPMTPRPALFSGPLSLRIGVASLLARSFGESLTMRQLKLILNTLVVDIAAQADRLGLYEKQLAEQWEALTQFDHGLVEGLRFQLEPADGAKAYPEYYLTALLRATATHVWPQLLDGNGGTDPLRDRFIALAAIGAELEVWPEAKLLAALDSVCPNSPQPLATRREFARFSRALFWSFGLIESRPREAEEGEISTAVEALAPTDERSVEGAVSPANAKEGMLRLIVDREVFDTRLLRMACALDPVDEYTLDTLARLKVRKKEVGILRPLMTLIEKAEDVALDWAHLAASLDDTVAALIDPPGLGLDGVLTICDRLLKVASRAAERGQPPVEGLAVVWRVLSKLEKQYSRIPNGHALHELIGRARRFKRDHPEVVETDRRAVSLINVLADGAFRTVIANRDPELARIHLSYGVEDDAVAALLEIATTTHPLEPGVLQLRRELGLALAQMEPEHRRREAFDLLLLLRGTSEWTEGILYVLGSLEQRLGADSSVVARVWELAYRMGERREQFLENFSSLLHSHSRPDLARIVDAKGQFPEQHVFPPVKIGEPEVEI